MSSPKIVEIAGEPSGRLVGKAAVEEYWSAALVRIPDLRFELLAVMHGIDSIVCIIAAQGGGLPPKFLFEFRWPCLPCLREVRGLAMHSTNTLTYSLA
jgi:hypothetical protein